MRMYPASTRAQGRVFECWGKQTRSCSNAGTARAPRCGFEVDLLGSDASHTHGNVGKQNLDWGRELFKCRCRVHLSRTKIEVQALRMEIIMQVLAINKFFDKHWA